MGLRVQEYGEILAYRLIAEGDHLLRRGTHYHPVLILDRETQQFIAYRPADAIDLEWVVGQVLSTRFTAEQVVTVTRRVLAEVFRRYGFQRGWRDAEDWRKTATANIVFFHGKQVVAGQHFDRQQFHRAGLQP